MADLSAPIGTDAIAMNAHGGGVVLRSLVIGLTAFLTVVDLFATQAILPSLTRHYGVTPAAMSLAVNASTFGMAVAGLIVGFSKDAPIGLVPENFAPAPWLGMLGFVGVIIWLYGWMLRRSAAAPETPPGSEGPSQAPSS